MGDRERLAADLHAEDVLTECDGEPDGPCIACIDEADRLIALGWTHAREVERLREAALALFDPMGHGSSSTPNAGHAVETLCAACVSVRAKRISAIRRALVAMGALQSVAVRAALGEEAEA